MAARTKSRIDEFVQKKKNAIYLILISVSVLIILFTGVAALKRNYFFVLNSEYEKPDIFSPKVNEVQFGTKDLSKQEYNFLYYSCLYRSYPQLKSLKFSQINNYINSTAYEGNNELSIAQMIQTDTEDLIITIYSYLQDAADKNIDIDVSDEVNGFMLSLSEEAAKLRMKLDDYLSAYYGEGVTADSISNIVTDYQAYKQYSSNMLKKSPKDISESLIEEYYSDRTDALDLYTISILTYEYNGEESEEDVAKIKDSINTLYEDTHNLNDFDHLAREFCEKYNKSEDDELAFYEKDREIDYYTLYLLSGDICSWVTTPDLKEDSTALFDTDYGYIVAYYQGRRRDDRQTYNGMYITADVPLTIEGGYAKTPPIYSNKDQSPYYHIINDIYENVKLLGDSVTSDDIINIAGRMVISDYSPYDDITLNPTLFSGSLLEYDQTLGNVTSWVADCKDGTVKLVEAEPYYSVFYLESRGAPYYKERIAGFIYQDECEEIEVSYRPMFENISYIK